MPYKDKVIGYTYKSFHAMRHRCLSKPEYKNVTICARWKNFNNFLADMGLRPENTVLDRINNDGHYEPSNCRWATFKESTANRRNTVYLDGERVNDLAERLHIPPGRIYNRLVYGWTKQEIEQFPDPIPPSKVFGIPFKKGHNRYAPKITKQALVPDALQETKQEHWEE